MDAAALAALADKRLPTDLPPATQTTDQVAAALTATQPSSPGAVGRFGADQVRSALAYTARVVAATRADRGYLCGPVSADPAAGLGTPSLKEYLADPANTDNKRAIEVPISSAGTTDDCGPLTWAGPGVVLGPQNWKASPTDGGGLTVTWEGKMGYVLVDGDGNAEPWGLDARGGYLLVPAADGWSLDGWDETTRGRISQAWPHDIALPDGYLARPAVPTGDPAALKALRDAAAAWKAAPGVTATTQASSENAELRDEKRGAAEFTATVKAAPARGDASGTSKITGDKPAAVLYLDAGTASLREVTRKVTAAPGKQLPKALRWIREDETEPSDRGGGYDSNPFGVVARIDAAGAIAPTACPPEPVAAACYTAVIATDGSDVPLAVRQADDLHRTGRPYTVLTAGLDQQGRLAFVAVSLESRAFGAPIAVLLGQTMFTDYTQTAPPKIDVPDPATVAPDADVEFS